MVRLLILTIELFTQFMVDQSKPVDPVTMTMLEDNNLADALREYAKTASPATRMWARTLTKYAVIPSKVC